MHKILKGVAVTLLLAVIGYALYVYFQPTQRISGMQADMVTTDQAILSEFEKDDKAAELRYKNKVVEFSGQVARVEQDSAAIRILFDRKGKFILVCSLEQDHLEDASSLKENQTVKIKGIYTGYAILDDMFMIPAEIKFGQCSIVK